MFGFRNLAVQRCRTSFFRKKMRKLQLEVVMSDPSRWPPKSSGSVGDFNLVILVKTGRFVANLWSFESFGLMDFTKFLIFVDHLAFWHNFMEKNYGCWWFWRFVWDWKLESLAGQDGHDSQEFQRSVLDSVQLRCPCRLPQSEELLLQSNLSQTLGMQSAGKKSLRDLQLPGLWQLINVTNEKFWRFAVAPGAPTAHPKSHRNPMVDGSPAGSMEIMQYSIYNASELGLLVDGPLPSCTRLKLRFPAEGTYNWHEDVGFHSDTAARVLSVSVQAPVGFQTLASWPVVSEFGFR